MKISIYNGTYHSMKLIPEIELIRCHRILSFRWLGFTLSIYFKKKYENMSPDFKAFAI